MKIESYFLSTSQIARLRMTMQNYADAARSRDERDAWLEGVACLQDAKPDYLMNLIPNNRPDRRAVLAMLDDLGLVEELVTASRAAAALGSIKSERKAKSSRTNGQRGGRPRKDATPSH